MAEAKTSKSRAWFFPTSPRSPYKLQGELKLLKQLEGEIWNADSQIKFAKLLQDYPDFDGNISAKDPAFSGRDRATRTPRLLGFVHFPKKGRKGLLNFTDVGNAFLDASDEEQVLIFQRQLSKVQFKSPLHDYGGFEEMSVKPMPVMIKLLLELGNMSKVEVALFGVTLIDHQKFDLHLNTIKEYRSRIAKLNSRERKIFREKFANSWVMKIYEADINAGHTKLREGGKDFIKTKISTLKDYADSTIRYLRATGLFTVSPHGQRLMLLTANIDDAKFILSNYGIGLSTYTNLDFDTYIDSYLGNPSLPLIRKDDPTLQIEDLNKMVSELAKVDSAEATNYQQSYNAAKSRVEKLQIIGRLENVLGTMQIINEAKWIRRNQTSSLTDIKDVYNAITSRQSEVLDRPLMYEWNTWRAMVLINDAKNIQGNYTTDPDGNPVSTAGGSKPDIQIEYDTFHLIVEVTLSSGKKQFEMEGEPISRHLGTLQKVVIENGDTRPVFGIFVAETLNETVISHLLTQARYKSQVYKGSIRILPMTRLSFEAFMESTLSHPNFSNRVLYNFFDSSFSDEAIQLGEYDWVSFIETKINKFTDINDIKCTSSDMI